MGCGDMISNYKISDAIVKKCKEIDDVFNKGLIKPNALYDDKLIPITKANKDGVNIFVISSSTENREYRLFIGGYGNLIIKKSFVPNAILGNLYNTYQYLCQLHTVYDNTCIGKPPIREVCIGKFWPIREFVGNSWDFIESETYKDNRIYPHGLSEYGYELLLTCLGINTMSIKSTIDNRPSTLTNNGLW